MKTRGRTVDTAQVQSRVRAELSFPGGISVLFFFVCLCACVWVSLPVPMQVEDRGQRGASSSATLHLTEIGSLPLNLGPTVPARMACRWSLCIHWSLPRNRSPVQHWDYRSSPIMLAFTTLLRIPTRSADFHSKHFTHGALSPAWDQFIFPLRSPTNEKMPTHTETNLLYSKFY